MVGSRDDLPPAGLLLTVCSGLPPTGGLAAALCMGFMTELMRRGVLLVDLFKQDLYRVVILLTQYRVLIITFFFQ